VDRLCVANTQRMLIYLRTVNLRTVNKWLHLCHPLDYVNPVYDVLQKWKDNQMMKPSDE